MIPGTPMLLGAAAILGDRLLGAGWIPGVRFLEAHGFLGSLWLPGEEVPGVTPFRTIRMTKTPGTSTNTYSVPHHIIAGAK